jgi:hypothetical protein
MIKRDYYPLNDAAIRIGCTSDDLLNLGAIGKIPIIALTFGLVGVCFNKEGKPKSSEHKIESIPTNYCYVPKESLIEHESGKARGKNKLLIQILNAPDDSGDYWAIDGENHGIPLNETSLFLLSSIVDTLISEHTNIPQKLPTEISVILKDKTEFTIDTNLPTCSDELAIALEAWHAVLSFDPPKPIKGSRKTFILKWLEENYPKISTSSKRRIAVLLNPDSAGGAPSY